MCGGSGIVIEHEGQCDDGGEGQPCAICRGEVSDGFVAMIERAAAQPGKTMTAEEFSAWLAGLDTGPSHPG